MLQETHIMEARELYKSYGRRQVLAGVDFRLEPGEMLGIIGENGAGKSTLLRLLAGELRPDRGEVTVNGTLGYCPQRIVVNDDLTVEQHLHFFRHAYRIQRLSRAYELVETLGYTRYLKARAGTLSGGTRQKLNLTIALMHEPDVVLMDEPYQGFDWQNYLNFWTIAEDLRMRGCAVLVISHIAHDTQRFDRLFHLRAGIVQPAEPAPADRAEDAVSAPEGAAA